MLKINVETIVKNILIIDDRIYFEDAKGEYVPTPCNRYSEGTDSYEASEIFLYGEEYLNFNDTEEVERFKEYCINQYRNDIYSFKYRSLSVVMDFIPDNEK